MKSRFIDAVSFVIAWLILTSLATLFTSDAKPVPCPEQPQCRSYSIREMVGIVTRYGMLVDQSENGTPAERRAAQDSLVAYNELYK